MRKLLACTLLAVSLGLTATTDGQIRRGSSMPATMLEDARKAAVAYADKRVQDEIKKQSKRAIIQLYRRLYGSGADKQLVRALGSVALSAKELDDLSRAGADAWASGDPGKVQDAAGQFSIALGKQLTRGLRDPQLRAGMLKLLDKPEKVIQLAGVIGAAAGGDPRAAQSYVGRALIALTPGANVFTAFETASQVMNYAHGKFVDAELEDLYQNLATGRTEEEVREALSGRGYTYIVGDKRRRLEAERRDALRFAEASTTPELFARLTRTSEDEVIEQIMASFSARLVQERREAAVAELRAQAQAEVDIILAQLDTVSYGRYGADWWEQRPRNLERFVLMVRERLAEDPVLDPNDPRDIRAMAFLLANGIVYGRRGEEYCEALQNFERLRLAIQGVPAPPPERLAGLCGPPPTPTMVLAGFRATLDHLHHAGGWQPQIVEQRDGAVTVRVDRPDHEEGLHCFVDLSWQPPPIGASRFELSITLRPLRGDGSPWNEEWSAFHREFRPRAVGYRVDLGYNGGAEPGTDGGPLQRRRGQIQHQHVAAFQPTVLAVSLAAQDLPSSVTRIDGATTSIRVVPQDVCSGEGADRSRRFVIALNYEHRLPAD
ncbi:MAG: hypothetical protein JJU22_08155 [Gammaproteobacteria bacterium]|nr:hypothetical protein [Gammaproteobacteria bacterium]